MRAVRLRSIHEVDAALWDSLPSDAPLLHAHRFIAAVEDAGVEESRFWYLLFFSGEEVVATAALCAFTVSLDLFLDRKMQTIVASLRRAFPHLLKIEILFCGLPISLGQHNLTIRDDRFAASVLACLDREMHAIARSAGIRYQCVKEFREDHAASLTELEERGFLKVRSIPYMEINLAWPNFQAFLAALRHPYRRSVLKSLKKLGLKAPVVECWAADLKDDRPRLMLGTLDDLPPPVFHRLYLRVMERASTRLETLNEPFFQACRERLRDDVEVLALAAGGEVLGAAMFAVEGDAMTFLLVGLATERNDAWDPYFNLVYGLVDLAMARGCTRLKLGQTAYWVKQRIGGQPHPVWFYLRADRNWVHRLLRLGRSVLFPETRLPAPRVFKEQGLA